MTFSSIENHDESGDQKVTIIGGTDDTKIGNVLDALKVYLAGGNSISSLNRRDLSNQIVTASGSSATFDTVGFGCMNLRFLITSVTGTTPELDIELQTSDDGSTWYALHDSKRFTAADTYSIHGIRITARYYKYVYTVSGTTPSFTITTFNTLKQFLPGRTASLFRYSDFDTTVVNNVSTVFRAETCENISLQVVRPTDGKAAAKFRVQGSIDGIKFDDLTADISIASNSSYNQSFSNQAWKYYKLIVVTKVKDSLPSDVYWHANGGN